MSKPRLNSSRVVFTASAAIVLTLLQGCSTLLGPFREAKTDSQLRSYVAGVTYPLSRKELARWVIKDLQANADWHSEHNALFDAATVVSTPTFEFHGRGCDFREIENDAHADSGVAFLHDDCLTLRTPAGETSRVDYPEGPITLDGIRETYVLYRVDGRPDISRVEIRNQSKNELDRTRIYWRELAFLERADPARGKELRARILADHPDIRLSPWEEK